MGCGVKKTSYLQILTVSPSQDSEKDVTQVGELRRVTNLRNQHAQNVQAKRAQAEIDASDK